ncbi:MAG TPA: hypothetical protein VN760_12070 [Casimicrobiaceae bacterium]|nr:hypothetical protein [Casimicrobiaceae bacterium]
MRGGKRYHIPSEPWTIWARLATYELGPLVKRRADLFPIPRDVRLNCAAQFFRDRNAGDAVGYYQGLADLLQLAGILEDDVSIVQWDGTRLLKDAENPRVELVLQEVA